MKVIKTQVRHKFICNPKACVNVRCKRCFRASSICMVKPCGTFCQQLQFFAKAGYRSREQVLLYLPAHNFIMHCGSFRYSVMIPGNTNLQPVCWFNIDSRCNRFTLIIIRNIRRPQPISHKKIIAKFNAAHIMPFYTNANRMQGYNVSRKQKRPINGWKKYPAMVVGIVPIINWCMYLS